MSIDQFRLTFELSPIILVGGNASQMPGAMQPIISLIGTNDFTQGILGGQSGADGGDIDFNAVAHFEPLPGTTLEEISVGLYPFANQQVAANAIIFEPLKISMLMIAPAPTQGGYPAKNIAFTSLKKALDQHMLQGGTFNVATPAYLYTACLLVALRDVTPPDLRQKQVNWQFDFIQPLLTMAAAQGAQNSLVSKITNGSKVQGDPPQQGGLLNTTGQSSPGIGGALVPGLQPSASTASAAPGGAAAAATSAASPITGG
jgi:hypothetical protein